LTKDNLADHSAALELARRIEQYWHDRGRHGVRTWLERIPNQPVPLWQVRSNIRWRPFAGA